MATATEPVVETQPGQQVAHQPAVERAAVSEEPQPQSQPHTRHQNDANAPLPRLPTGQQGVRFRPESQFIPAPQYVQYRTPDDKELPFSTTWHIVKIFLSILCLICSAAIFGIGIALVAQDSYRYDSGLWVFALSAGSAGASILWIFIEFLVICCSSRKPQRGMHPGAHVGVHLIIWLYTVAVIAIVSILLGDAINDDVYYSYYYTRFWYSGGSLLQAMIAFLAILLVAHFALFVRACVECHRYNRAMRMVYVPVPAVSHDGPMSPGVGYYGQHPAMVQVPPTVARQMGAAPHQMVPHVQGYHTAQPYEQGIQGGPHQGQSDASAAYGYYAPTGPQAPVSTPAKRKSAMRTAPVAGSSTAASSSNTAEDAAVQHSTMSSGSGTATVS